MASGTRITPAPLMIALLIETDHRRLSRNPVFYEEGTLDRPHPMFPFVDVRGFEQDFVVCQWEMRMEQRYTETIQTAVLLQNQPNLLQARSVTVPDRNHIGDMPQRTPLHGLHCNLAHGHSPFSPRVRGRPLTRGMASGRQSTDWGDIDSRRQWADATSPDLLIPGSSAATPHYHSSPSVGIDGTCWWSRHHVTLQVLGTLTALVSARDVFQTTPAAPSRKPSLWK